VSIRNKLLAALLLAGTSTANAQTRFVTFGGSLSDNGNLFAITGALPNGPYASRTFSNGPVWITQIAGP
jgi:outer membrane lipase/esterase